jgi:carbonic anhydrase/acetyltransferase-like protein (isoleucine patch superfamily)
MQHIFDSAWVTGNARVTDDAQVGDNAWVGGYARVGGDAWVGDNAWVGGYAHIMSDTDWTMIIAMIDTLTAYRSRCADGYEIRNNKGELVNIESLTDDQKAKFFDWFSGI